MSQVNNLTIITFFQMSNLINMMIANGKNFTSEFHKYHRFKESGLCVWSVFYIINICWRKNLLTFCHKSSLQPGGTSNWSMVLTWTVWTDNADHCTLPRTSYHHDPNTSTM